LTSDSTLSRAQGCWLGQIVGDALGTTVEFQTPTSIARRYPQGLREIIGGGPFSLKPGQVTDDTELALALARSIVGEGRYERDAVATAYQAWYRSDPFDIGGTTRRAFGGKLVTAKEVEARANTNSQANGSLMRASPLGVIGWCMEPEKLAELAVLDSRLSHPHPVCCAAVAIYTHAIAHSIRTGEGPAQTYAATVDFARQSLVCEPAIDSLLQAEVGPPDDFVDRMGWVRIALQNAFHQLLAAPSLEAGVVATVQAGGDTDTNGCISGALLGAVHGLEAVPERWKSAVLACRTDRGPTFQTDDALELAGALVRTGAVLAAQMS
jgi:ADP-ribosyl-[dinitrogen reductase] hydrolase